MENSLARLFQSDILDSQRYWENCHSKASLPPEKMLMLAVLEDAVGCIQKHARRPNSLLFREAADWILDGTADWSFSFENICAVLGLDADYIRDGLLDWSGKKVVKMRREALKKARTGRNGFEACSLETGGLSA